MTTSLYLDAIIKKKVTERAKENNLSLSTVARILLSDYAEGKIEIGTRSKNMYEVSEISVDNDTQKKMDSIAAKWRNLKK